MALRGSIAVVLTAATASVAVAASAPRTVSTFHGEAKSVAAATGRLAWTDSLCRIHFARAGTARVSTQSYCKQYSEYDFDSQLTFAGSRPLWLGTTGGNFTPIVQKVWTTNDGGLRVVGRVSQAESAGGGYISAVAGSPAGGAFGVAQLKDLSSSGCFCQFVLTGGGVWTVADGRARHIAGLPPPSLLARSGDDVALVPVEPGVQREARLDPAPDAPVEVRSLRDASTISTFASPRPLDALALTSRFVFTIVGYGKTTRLEVHDPSSGLLLRSLHPASLAWLDIVGIRSPPSFDAAGRWAVYGNPHEVWAVDGTSGRASLIARTTWVVRDVSTDGRTVTWAEAEHPRGHALAPPRVAWVSRFRTMRLP